MAWIILLIATVVVIALFQKRKNNEKPIAQFPILWRSILDQRVLFYHNLSAAEKNRFEKDVSRFLKNVRVTGVNIEIDITDKLLVASSAAIPVFGFPDWDYTFLDEVLLYPGSFDSNYASTAATKR